MSETAKPIVRIEYCTRCKWRLRAAWYAQELLSTFEADLGSVSLTPSDVAGFFRICADERGRLRPCTGWRLHRSQDFEAENSDLVAPNRPLGHVDSE